MHVQKFPPLLCHCDPKNTLSDRHKHFHLDTHQEPKKESGEKGGVQECKHGIQAVPIQVIQEFERQREGPPVVCSVLTLHLKVLGGGLFQEALDKHLNFCEVDWGS